MKRLICILNVEARKRRELLVFSLLMKCFSSFTSVLEAGEYEVTPRIRQITVFFSGALIERSCEVSLPEGYHQIVLTPLEKNIHAQSIQVKGKGNAVILNVSTKTHYLDLTTTQQYHIYQDSLNFFQKQLSLINGQLANLETEREVLKANQSIKGENTNVTAQELLAILNLYRSRLDEITRKEIQLKTEKEKVEEQIERIKLILKELGGRKSKRINQIVLDLWCKKEGNVNLEVSYLVPDAKWSPEYLIKVEEMGKPVQLELYAIVSQSTDQSWDRIPVTISTATPTENLAIPVLTPWWLSLHTSYPVTKRQDHPKYLQFAMDGEGATAPENILEKASELPEVETLERYTEVATQTLNLSFRTQIPFSIESNQKPYKILLTTYEIPARYQYISVPKKDPAVFLTAVLNKWDLYHLLPANARLFFENQYTGTFYLNPRIAADSLLLSLGKDPDISVSYELLAQYTKVKTVGNFRKETRTYQIKIRNNKSKRITLTVYDQIPLSTSSEIEVTPLELNGGQLEKTEGKVTWEVALEPNEVKSIQWSVEVKYPKEKMIDNW